MSVLPKTIGPYELDREIGRGGMGVVYLARDTKLERAVAVKTLPADVVADSERLARFEREARLLATLNHPNIAAVYGLEEVDGSRYLALEYVDGETLDERLERGPLALDEALSIAKDIAEAIEAAHQKDIIHRDLKPGNVKITTDGRVKVLDFGLAKAVQDQSSMTSGADSPTIVPVTSPTMPGVILGTAGYMSPEQARGRSVDKRSDIWSFGCMLFEMISGGRIFPGETVTDSLGATLHREPDWGLLPPETPPTIRLLLRRCLQKDRRRRLQDIGDARIELEEVIADPNSSSLSLADAAWRASAPPAPSWRRAVPWILSAVLALGLGVTALGLWRSTRAAPANAVRLSALVSPDLPLAMNRGAGAVLSPDGRLLAYVVRDGQTRHLYVRRTDQLDGAPLSGTEGARAPFFSPDGEWIGFFTDRHLRKVSTFGGAPLTLAPAPDGRGGTWSPDGIIYYTPDVTTGIMRIPAAGGKPEPLTTPDNDANERSHRWPCLLPNGKGIVFTAQDRGQSFNEANIEVLNLENGERKILHQGGSHPRYASSGHLTYLREGTLFAVPFDQDRLELAGSPAPVIEGVVFDTRNGGAQYDYSATGTLVYQPGSMTGGDTTVIEWARDGATTTILDGDGSYQAVAYSPDGSRVALHRDAQDTSDVWVYEFDRENLVRLTFDAGFDVMPVWTPDGKHVLFASTREGDTPNLFMKRSDGSGRTERLTTATQPQFPTSITPDGTVAAFHQQNDETGWDMYTLRLDGSSEPEVFLQTSFQEGGPVFSPDGRWIAYGSNESGAWEVYVRPFPDGGGKWMVSTDGGDFPRWGPEGNELYFVREGVIMVAPVTAADGSFRADRPKALFEEPYVMPDFFTPYDISPDGQRFVIVKDVADRDAGRTQATFVFNWFDELKQRVPVGK